MKSHCNVGVLFRTASQSGMSSQMNIHESSPIILQKKKIKKNVTGHGEMYRNKE